jgi:hypothetical protein
MEGGKFCYFKGTNALEQHLDEVHDKQAIGLTNGRWWVFDTCTHRRRRIPDFTATTPKEFKKRIPDKEPHEEEEPLEETEKEPDG